MADDDSSAMVTNRAILEAFVLRARRIEMHSLASDRTLLHKMSTELFTVLVDPLSMQPRIEVNHLPDEEAFESLAARVRPMFLEKELANLPKSINALQFFLQGDKHKETRARLVSIREAFISMKTKTAGDGRVTGAERYSVQLVQADGTKWVLTDFELADAWLNIDVVHADRARHEAAHQVGLRERFRAAVMVYSEGAVRALETLDAVRAFYNAGHLRLSETTWTESVVASETEQPILQKVFIAPVGTSKPRVSDGLGPEWERVF